MNQNELTGPEALFNRAVDLINKGDIGTAVIVCRTALEKNPQDITMTALLGAVLLKTRDLAEAESHLRHATQMAPSFAKPHEDLGFLLVESGRAAEAVGMLETATRLDANSENAHFTLGRALAELGKGHAADTAFEKSFALNPERKKLAIAAEHHKAGRHTEAEKMYRDLLQKHPRNVDAMRLLAGISVNNSLPEEAETLLRRAVSIAPDYALAFLDLGHLLNDQHRYREAIECFAQTVRLEPNRAKTHFSLGSALAQTGQTLSALEAYRHALRVHPRHIGALLGFGHMLKTVGKQDKAIKAYRQCIDAKPDNGESYWSLANLKTYQLTDDDVQAMRSAIENSDDLTDQSRVNFLFALAKACEDENNFDEAWDYYERGNKLQRTLEYYDPVQTESINDELINVFDGDLLKKKGGMGYSDASPIFVVGLPRSGSTLIEQILASHTMVEGTAELPYLGRVATSLNLNRADGVNYPHAVRELAGPNLTALGEKYLELAQIHRQSDKPQFVDKNPNNFPSIGLLHLILPNAKIIDARRYPLDSTLSCYRQLFAKGQTFVYDLTDVGEYFLQYQRMMDHWHDVLPGRVLTVQYEELVTDFDNQLRRILEYCELPWEDGCAQFHSTDRPVRTASSEQVRQPVYTKSINFWRNYECHLGELIEILQPVLPRYPGFESYNRPSAD